MPCLSVSAKSGVWNKYGFDNFGNATWALHKHKSPSEHICCVFGLSKLKKNLSLITIKDALKENSRYVLNNLMEMSY